MFVLFIIKGLVLLFFLFFMVFKFEYLFLENKWVVILVFICCDFVYFLK